MDYSPENWLVNFKDFNDANGNPYNDGRPFGNNSEMASRVLKKDPWDVGCIAETLIGGYDTMKEIRKSFETVIQDAKKSANPPGQRGHVYMAGWRVNANRDLSENSEVWPAGDAMTDNDKVPFNERTAWGLIQKLMQAGVKVRIMVWLPHEPFAADPFAEHRKAHVLLAKLIEQLNDKLKIDLKISEDLGVVFLDSRICERNEMKSSHHQKFVVIRSLNTHIAFCGGVDLAYTRRDFQIYKGDWQSSSNIPPHNLRTAVVKGDFSAKMGTDLPEKVYGTKQSWHDQHLKLQGPIVATLETIFCQRWTQPAQICIAINKMDGDVKIPFNAQGVYSSSENAFETHNIEKTFDCKKNSTIVFDTNANSFPVVPGYTVGSYHRDREGNGFNIVFNFNIQPLTLDIRDLHTDQILVKYTKITVKDLFPVIEVPAIPGSTTIIQALQTIPLRNNANYNKIKASLTVPLTSKFDIPIKDTAYSNGEFSVMPGIVKACKSSSQFIFICDQYFWSVPYAILLKQLLNKNNNLYIILILPPYSDSTEDQIAESQHSLRNDALLHLEHERVGIYSLWKNKAVNSECFGMYCHAKVQLFDDALMICGSANINQRSHTNDTELVCSVLDKQMVQGHYRKLWNYLFNNNANIGIVPFPITFGEVNWGKLFFDSFNNIAKQNNNDIKLIADPYKVIYDIKINYNSYEKVLVPQLLPNGVKRYNIPYAFSASNTIVSMFDINNPCGFDNDINKPKETTSLENIVERLEGPKSENFRK